MNLPPEIKPGQPIRADWLNQLLRYLRSITPRESPHIRVHRGPAGTTFHIPTHPFPKPKTQTQLHPFQIYPDPDATGDAAWRTVKVNTGYVNETIPSNINNSIVVPASTLFYKIWLDVELNSEAYVTSCTIAHGPSGWTNYPYQPTASGGTPPPRVYILIGELVTGTDDEGPNQHNLSILQPVRSSLKLVVYVYGLYCSSSGINVTMRIAWARV